MAQSMSKDSSMQDESRNSPGSQERRARRGRRSGVQIVEFSLCLIPMLSLVTVLMTTTWAIFAKASLQRAVREGVRSGITLTAGQMVGSACLTDTVKGIVQTDSFGFLSGASGLAKIKVNYYLPPAASSSGAVTDVSGNNNGDVGGNIMQVSVQSFTLTDLIPRIYGTRPVTEADGPFVFSVYSADLIEPNTNPPCIGVAP
jgi:hypothetical protein